VEGQLLSETSHKHRYELHSNLKSENLQHNTLAAAPSKGLAHAFVVSPQCADFD